MKVLMDFTVDRSAAQGNSTFDSLTNQALRASKLVAGSKDLSSTRVNFEHVTMSITAYADNYGVGDNSVYQFFCPMAFDGEGALWLQRDSNSQNPYYGTKMLKCGISKRVFKGTKESNTKATDNKVTGQEHKDH